ncbi:hypothetical protein PIIN_07578 [Serendipita indica DSM 11827]|uniref:Uncharacterized protein n=1 Tax=Serendipita indica (strain DSM 11827) TaxID=1109443 RepID=G4TQN2_SERID|nr:hypothetical protein PIIN_07578 [Serendipita indica DSM 11827]
MLDLRVEINTLLFCWLDRYKDDTEDVHNPGLCEIGNHSRQAVAVEPKFVTDHARRPLLITHLDCVWLVQTQAADLQSSIPIQIFTNVGQKHILAIWHAAFDHTNTAYRQIVISRVDVRFTAERSSIIPSINKWTMRLSKSFMPALEVYRAGLLVKRGINTMHVNLPDTYWRLWRVGMSNFTTFLTFVAFSYYSSSLAILMLRPLRQLERISLLESKLVSQQERQCPIHLCSMEL